MPNEADRHAPVAIVGCTPHRNNGLVKHEFEAFHSQLMCSRDEVNGIIIRKRFCDVGAKKITRTSG